MLPTWIAPTASPKGLCYDMCIPHQEPNKSVSPLHRLTLVHLPRVVWWFETLLFEMKSVAAITMVAILGGARKPKFTVYLVFSCALGPKKNIALFRDLIEVDCSF
jgi:hypothetical protein